MKSRPGAHDRWPVLVLSLCFSSCVSSRRPVEVAVQRTGIEAGRAAQWLATDDPKVRVLDEVDHDRDDDGILDDNDTDISCSFHARVFLPGKPQPVDVKWNSFGRGNEQTHRAKTSIDGVLDGIASEGRVQLVAFTPGFLPDTASFNCDFGERMKIDLSLSPAARVIEGIIVDDQGKPRGDATLTMDAGIALQPSLAVRPDGTFLVPLGERGASLNVSGDVLSHKRFHVEANATRAELQVDRGAYVHGKVRGGPGAPLHVEVLGYRFPGSDVAYYRVDSDDESYRFEVPPDAPIRIDAVREDSGASWRIISEPIRLARGEEAAIDLTLKEARIVNVQVVDPRGNAIDPEPGQVWVYFSEQEPWISWFMGELELPRVPLILLLADDPGPRASVVLGPDDTTATLVMSRDHASPAPRAKIK